MTSLVFCCDSTHIWYGITVLAAASRATAKLCLLHLFPSRLSEPAFSSLLSADESDRESQRDDREPELGTALAAAQQLSKAPAAPASANEQAMSEVFDRAGAVIAAARAKIDTASARNAHSTPPKEVSLPLREQRGGGKAASGGEAKTSVNVTGALLQTPKVEDIAPRDGSDSDVWDEYVTPDGFLYYHNVRNACAILSPLC
jgi:hypothetical protein